VQKYEKTKREMQSCPKNYFLNNWHSVSLTELITADVLLPIGLGYIAGSKAGYGSIGIIIVIILLLIINSILHWMWGMDTNFNYYLGIGGPPHIFKVCKCYK